MNAANFGLIDYFRMGRARGLRLPVIYFFQNHLFDIIHGTDTHLRLEKQSYLEKPEGYENGILYMSCLKREFKSALNKVKKFLGSDFPEYQFIDLGCGKGKSLLVYCLEYGNLVKHKALGIEYYRPLAEVANDNISLMRLNDKAQVYHDDARNYLQYIQTNKLLIFLYNPFGAEILSDVLSHYSGKEILIIYIDPAHTDIILNAGFFTIYKKKGRYPSETFSVFAGRFNDQ